MNITNLHAPATGVLPRLRQGITLSTDEDFGTLAFRGVKVGRPILVASQAMVRWVEDELGQQEGGTSGGPAKGWWRTCLYVSTGADLRHGDTMGVVFAKITRPRLLGRRLRAT